MKRLIVVLLTALSVNALAIDAVGLITPSPLGAVIAYNSYMKDRKKVYYVRVQSQARDFEQAKKQAFRLASEQVAGTVVLSESELRNSNLTRDEIITYSSGLIDEYKIVDRFDGSNFVKLTMDVWITESVMAQRLLAKSATERGVNGADLSTRVESILDEGERGDNIFRTILLDFPKRAFRITTDPPNIYMDQYRNTQVSIFVKVEWDEKFVDAFEDAARKTGHRKCRFGCSDFRFFIQDFEFNDNRKLVMIDDYIAKTNPVIQIELKSLNGQIIQRQCYDFSLQNADFYLYRVNQLNLHSSRTLQTRLYLNLGQNTATMSQFENILIQVVPSLQCALL